MCNENKTNKIDKFVNYMRETLANKLCAIALVTAGLLPVYLADDATTLVLMLIFAIPLFFSSKRHVF